MTRNVLKFNCPDRASRKLTVDVLHVARSFMIENREMLPPPLVESLEPLFQRRDFKGVAECLSDWAEPQLYCSASSFYAVSQLYGFVSKYPAKIPGVDRKARALGKFKESEQKCSETNLRLLGALHRPLSGVYGPLLTRAREICSTILGEEVPLDELWGENPDGTRDGSYPLGPGMVIGSVDATETTPYYKVGARQLTCTRECLPYVKHYLSLPGPHQHFVVEQLKRGEVELSIVRGNRVTSVPKSWKTDRTIAVEPFFNSFFQSLVDRLMRKRLRRVGVDLRHQDRNQHAASVAATWDISDFCGRPATLDLSSASDSVSYYLVHLLLPKEWVALLEDLRSPMYWLDGKVHVYEKWSSMGNGYTFPLESLIFYALAQACHESVGWHGYAPRIYGDDIVVCRGSAALLIELLRYCGFEINPEKSFIFGEFRESCGVNRWGEYDVTPVRLDQALESLPAVFSALNRIGQLTKLGVKSDAAYEALLTQIPEDLRFFGPPQGETDWIWAPAWFKHPSFRIQSGPWASQCTEHDEPPRENGVVTCKACASNAFQGLEVIACELVQKPKEYPMDSNLLGLLAFLVGSVKTAYREGRSHNVHKRGVSTLRTRVTRRPHWPPVVGYYWPDVFGH